MLDYNKMKKATDKYYELNLEKYRKEISKEIEKAIFNELVINILNQHKLEYIYTFKAKDFEFVDKYHIDIQKLIKEFQKYI